MSNGQWEVSHPEIRGVVILLFPVRNLCIVFVAKYDVNKYARSNTINIRTARLNQQPHACLLYTNKHVFRPFVEKVTTKALTLSYSLNSCSKILLRFTSFRQNVSRFSQIISPSRLLNFKRKVEPSGSSSTLIAWDSKLITSTDDRCLGKKIPLLRSLHWVSVPVHLLASATPWMFETPLKLSGNWGILLSYPCLSLVDTLDWTTVVRLPRITMSHWGNAVLSLAPPSQTYSQRVSHLSEQWRLDTTRPSKLTCTSFQQPDSLKSCRT